MFENIGGKIKKLAIVITIIGIIISFIIGIMLSNEFGLGGFIVILGGSLLSWIGSFLLYGFGEIIDLLRKISGETSETDNEKLYEVDNTSYETNNAKIHKTGDDLSNAESKDFGFVLSAIRRISILIKEIGVCALRLEIVILKHK